jgi:hypothetical protein
VWVEEEGAQLGLELAAQKELRMGKQREGVTGEGLVLLKVCPCM